MHLYVLLHRLVLLRECLLTWWGLLKLVLFGRVEDVCPNLGSGCDAPAHGLGNEGAADGKPSFLECITLHNLAKPVLFLFARRAGALGRLNCLSACCDWCLATLQPRWMLLLRLESLCRELLRLLLLENELLRLLNKHCLPICCLIDILGLCHECLLRFGRIRRHPWMRRCSDIRGT